jgi:hypothetical protein
MRNELESEVVAWTCAEMKGSKQASTKWADMCNIRYISESGLLTLLLYTMDIIQKCPSRRWLIDGQYIAFYLV